jgi:voltage-gated potassium channel
MPWLFAWLWAVHLCWIGGILDRLEKIAMLLRQRTWEIFEVADQGDSISRLVDYFLLTLIFTNVVAVIAGTVDSIAIRFGDFLDWFELFSVVVFTAEYLGRLWSCTVRPKYAHPVTGRLRFALTPMEVIDLLAILPFYLPFLGVDLRFLRVLRLLRIFRVAKLGRYVESIHLFAKVLQKKKEELVLTLGVVVFLLVITASLMYFTEHDAQPESFPNIPATMWWAVATLTTVGYGDVYPITAAGRVLGAVVAILGIGLFALPTAILGSGFLEAIQETRQPKVCPHCGEVLE